MLRCAWSDSTMGPSAATRPGWPWSAAQDPAQDPAGRASPWETVPVVSAGQDGLNAVVYAGRAVADLVETRTPEGATP